jgi:hypothetical protein
MVKPESDKANDTARQAIQQAAPSVNHAQAIEDCIAKAAGDVNKIAACNR